MKKKYWSKYRPNSTCEVLGKADSRGAAPAYVTDVAINEDPFATAIILNEWSDVEVVPVPLSVPDVGFVLIYGDDPDSPKYEFFDRETDAAVALSKRMDAFGYAPVTITRFAMIPKS